MNRTKIEWCHFTWNPITGCSMGCDYCYARKIVERFPKKYPMGFRPNVWQLRLPEPVFEAKPARIFTCSMGDFWGPEIPMAAQADIFNVMRATDRHRYLILTKRPQNIVEPKDGWPSNLWLGVTVDRPGTESRINLLRYRWIHSHTGFRPFVSCEPLLGPLEISLEDIQWVIIGQQTNPTVEAHYEWVRAILDEADNCAVPVFMKNNLGFEERLKVQEYPFNLQVKR